MRYLISIICIALLLWGCDTTAAVPEKPKVVRKRIVALGGEVRFESHVTGILVEDRKVKGVTVACGKEIDTDIVVAAIGHSARDTFEMLHRIGITCEQKAFSIGARIEHSQQLIDKTFKTRGGKKIAAETFIKN